MILVISPFGPKVDLDGFVDIGYASKCILSDSTHLRFARLYDGFADIVPSVL